MRFISIVASFIIFFNKISCDEHPDTYLTTEELVQKYGYPIESHEVTTEDGYIITIFRIKHGRNGKEKNSKPALLMHGLLGQCENFLINGMNNGSLAYLLADNGYDVWLGNTRGTQHGRKHNKLDPSEKDFWNFSWHEIGMYDIPALVDFILSETSKKKLHYIGHSQGGTVLFIMASMKPEYQKKLGIVSLLAPAAYMRHLRSPFIWPLVLVDKELLNLSKLLGVYEWPTPPFKIGDLLIACKHTIFRLRHICEISYHIGIGGDSGLFKQEMLPLLLRFVPSVSVKQLAHFAQGINSGHFRPWDYGEGENYDKYGQAIPPDYPVENITTPIAMYIGKNDIMASVEDINEMCDVLPNCIRRYLVPHEKFTHLDFLTATRAHALLNIPLLTFLKKHDYLLN